MLLALVPSLVAAQDTWPRRVLITNDDGIEAPAVQRLARGFVDVAEVYLVAPSENKSGASTMMAALAERGFRVERRDVGPGIRGWAVDGYPADCVLFGVAGLLRDSPPDLVISGINGGSNLGDSWFLSGTVGAARAAAFLGIPAIAVSGVNTSDSAAVDAVVAWVVAFSQSEVVRALEPGQYLTVSLPVRPPEEITGIEVAVQARILGGSAAPRADSDSTVWDLQLRPNLTGATPESDVGVVLGGKIAIGAMRVDETDPDLRRWLELHRDAIPAWPSRQ